VIIRDGISLGWLTVAEAARYVGVGVREFRRLVLAEGIPYVKTGNQRRFRPQDLESWADTRVCQSSIAVQGERSTSAVLPSTVSVSLSPRAREILDEQRKRLNSSTIRRGGRKPRLRAVPGSSE
jgi:excisionase family DNA binding protein